MFSCMNIWPAIIHKNCLCKLITSNSVTTCNSGFYCMFFIVGIVINSKCLRLVFLWDAGLPVSSIKLKL